MKRQFITKVLELTLLGLFFFACDTVPTPSLSSPDPTATQSPTSTPTEIPSPTNTSVPTETPSPTETPEPFVKITYPADGGILTCTNPVEDGSCLFNPSGTTGGVGSFNNLRLYVFVFPVNPPGAGWYLQKSPAAIESNGNWAQSPSALGDEKSSAVNGHTLRIRAVLVTRDATLNGRKLEDLAKSKELIVLSAVEDIDGIVAISDVIDLTLAR